MTWLYDRQNILLWGLRMPHRRKVFRIEEALGIMPSYDMDFPSDMDMPDIPSSSSMSSADVSQIMDELRAIRTILQPDHAAASKAAAAADEVELERLRVEKEEAMKLKGELEAIQEAISDTKAEIAALHESGFSKHMVSHKFTDELDAVVIGTEAATEAILSASESIDEDAAKLSKMLTGEAEDITGDISNKVIEIFEACNFQDITGQRINKVVTALRFIEERIHNMIEIWGGMEAFKDIEAKEVLNPYDDSNDDLLHGPSMEDDEDTSSQDDIDALFG